ncbi:hypothetical protein K0M31_019218 [Melipona bicolor]|uniref:Uncharacterized protein n=1 Tax=Melipona bicolor TaxID=60889 RepID=A0AA40KQX2_9HYME|nr:hypothetical protein K0M31_019218 [Melipona bicolor]
MLGAKIAQVRNNIQTIDVRRTYACPKRRKIAFKHFTIAFGHLCLNATAKIPHEISRGHNKSSKLKETKMKIVVIGGVNTLCQTEEGGGEASACHCKPVNGVQLRIRGNERVSKRKETEPAKESSGSDISVSRSGWLAARFWTCRDAGSTKTGTTAADMTARDRR